MNCYCIHLPPSSQLAMHILLNFPTGGGGGVGVGGGGGGGWRGGVGWGRVGGGGYSMTGL